MHARIYNTQRSAYMREIRYITPDVVFANIAVVDGRYACIAQS